MRKCYKQAWYAVIKHLAQQDKPLEPKKRIGNLHDVCGILTYHGACAPAPLAPYLLMQPPEPQELIPEDLQIIVDRLQKQIEQALILPANLQLHVGTPGEFQLWLKELLTASVTTAGRAQSYNGVCWHAIPQCFVALKVDTVTLQCCCLVQTNSLYSTCQVTVKWCAPFTL